MRSIILLIWLLTMTGRTAAQNFKEAQLKFPRVSGAYTEKWKILERDLRKENFNGPFKMHINAFKAEGKLEVWLRSWSEKKFRLFRSYDFCAQSGILGPKLKEGDKQTPEGFYFINVFNPRSSFHLSLGLNYPNESDKVRSGKENPGSDIYIHGDCVTVGCIPLTDDLIKEVYILAVEARNNRQKKIPVHIYPFKMTTGNLEKFTGKYPDLQDFWTGLHKEFSRNSKHFSQVP